MFSLATHGKLMGSIWQPRSGSLALIPRRKKITYMTTWVGMNGLNVEYFKVDVMEKIGNLIGNTMKVEGRTDGVVYEGIQLVCFECGFYGHGRDTCPIIIKVKAQAVDTVVVENMGVTARVTANGLNVDHPARTDADNPAKKHGE
ncbi:PREDICTED: LOC110747385 [Prunus dulcis]|uniref:PREDICTED: LOC110747385 n=1 Tax=Prunus dulcis TaxID=3755 RepID=A0A5E4FNJ0_PRUDU|nr:PREDICTED: LOC110747385 [Prunus dulcis]